MIKLIKTNEDVDCVIKEHPKTFIYKHSTQCSISEQVLSKLEDYLSKHKEVTVYQINVIENRFASNYVEKISGVLHESPQLLIYENGNVVSHCSHRAIDELYLEKYLK